MIAPRLAVMIFARMSSSRLPGKALMDFAGRPLLGHIITRAMELRFPLIVATSLRPEDDAIAGAAREAGVSTFRGSLDNVLQRAVDCAHAHGIDAFARLCGDRPWFPVDQMRTGLMTMADALEHGERLDLVTNHVPDLPPPGLSTEVIRVSALERVLAGDPTETHREHLTSGLYDAGEAFVIKPIVREFHATRAHRFAVDTIDDYLRLGEVARSLSNPHADPEAVAELLSNAHHEPARLP